MNLIIGFYTAMISRVDRRRGQFQEELCSSKVEQLGVHE